MARQLRQLSARSHAITNALDNQGLPLQKDEDDVGLTSHKEDVYVRRDFRTVMIQATPVMNEKSVQASISDSVTAPSMILDNHISEPSLADEAVGKADMDFSEDH